jgi:hypothetical protein
MNSMGMNMVENFHRFGLENRDVGIITNGGDI